MADTSLTKDPLLSKMADLLKQATTEKSHYYVASVLCEAMTRIEQLQMSPAEVIALAEGDDGADTQALLKSLCRRVEGQRKHIATLQAKLSDKDDEIKSLGGGYTKKPRRQSRCPHGVHELNRCERCD